MSERITPQQMIGRKYGRLTVVSVAQNKGKTQAVNCLCECGAHRTVIKYDILKGATKSCGCLAHDLTVSRNSSHGEGQKENRTPEYRTWASMIQRCTNQRAWQFQFYGARGISICDRWTEHKKGYENFLEDMGRRPSTTHSIERINVDGNYGPQNCRWASKQEQVRNRTDNRTFEIDGTIRCLSEWAEIYKLNYGSVRTRLRMGWTIREALGIDHREKKTHKNHSVKSSS